MLLHRCTTFCESSHQFMGIWVVVRASQVAPWSRICLPRQKMQERSRLHPWAGKILWSRKWQPTLPGGAEVKASAWNAGDPGSIPSSGRSPGEENATHSSVLAWEIPWTGKPGRLQSMGSQKSQTHPRMYAYSEKKVSQMKCIFPVSIWFVRLRCLSQLPSHQEMPDQDSLLAETVTTETDLF